MIKQASGVGTDDYAALRCPWHPGRRWFHIGLGLGGTDSAVVRVYGLLALKKLALTRFSSGGCFDNAVSTGDDRSSSHGSITV